MLELNALEKRYGKTVVLNRVSARFPARAIHFVMGPNGSGKSTLLRCILGLETYRGSITWHGRPIDPSARQVFPVFDDPPFYPGLTGRQNLAVLAPDSLDRPRRYVDDALLRRRFDTFSRGQAMRLGLTAALNSGAELIVLDEPANGLDRETMATLAADLAAMRAKTTFVITGHQLEFYESLIDTVTVVRGADLQGPTQVESGGCLADAYDAAAATDSN